jgi:peptide/nickel transport system ATP-binding protein
MANIILDVKGLTVRTPGGECLIHDVDLMLREEERLGIAAVRLRETVTAKAILGLLPPQLTLSAKSLSILGQDALTLPERERSALLA